MNAEPTFLAPFEKIKRAAEQITDLNTAIRAFFKATPYEIVSHVDFEADEEVWRFQLTGKIPHHLSVRVGEILHNLRSTLDQMLAEIVVRVSKQSESGVEFPFGVSLDNFEAALGFIRDHCHNPTPWPRSPSSRGYDDR